MKNVVVSSIFFVFPDPSLSKVSRTTIWKVFTCVYIYSFGDLVLYAYLQVPETSCPLILLFSCIDEIQEDHVLLKNMFLKIYFKFRIL